VSVTETMWSIFGRSKIKSVLGVCKEGRRLTHEVSLDVLFITSLFGLCPIKLSGLVKLLVLLETNRVMEEDDKVRRGVEAGLYREEGVSLEFDL